MIRFILRFIGLLLLAAGFVILVYDGAKSIVDQSLPRFSTVGEIWANIHQSSLLGLQPVAERFVGSRVWRALVQPYFLDQWAWLVLTLIAAILILLGRKKKPLIGYARD